MDGISDPPVPPTSIGFTNLNPKHKIPIVKTGQHHTDNALMGGLNPLHPSIDTNGLDTIDPPPTPVLP
jgi:hypothetical protein